MPVDPSFVGRTYPPTEPYRVSREKIREFADAIGDANPAYRSVDAARALGHADVVAPPTFAIVITLPAGGQFIADPEAGVDYSRVVHGDQRFVHERPLVAGDEITATLTVDTIRVAGGNEIIGNRTEVHTVDGELVSTAYATIVVRGGRVVTEVKVGEALPAQDFPLHRADLIRYAGASGDFNVIHWNERVATSVGLPNVIAHGMFTMATAVRVVTDWTGDPAGVVEYGVRFTRPVAVPDPEGAVLHVEATVRSVRDDGLVEIDLTASVDGQTVMAKARAVTRAPGTTSGAA